MYVNLRGLRYFARHGVMEQEQQVGAYFTVDLRLELDFGQAAVSDDLGGTVNYAEVHEVVKAEMEHPSQVLENVAYRIARNLLLSFPQVDNVWVAVSKENPPMGAESQQVGAELRLFRR
jgi:dihydroneopterin aldolase